MSLLNQDGPLNASSKPKQYLVRAAAADDLPQVVEILILSFYPKNVINRWVYPLMRLGITEDLKVRIKSPASRYLCLAAVLKSNSSTPTDSQTLVGTVEISLRSQLWPPFQPRRPYIANLAVNDQNRRQGVAQSLLKSCETIATQWGFSKLFLHVKPQNAQAMKLYKKMGYKPCDRQSRWLASQRLLLSKHL